MSITLRAWGEYACFTRPDFKVERVSYDVITPSAARGLLEAIYWKPQFTWVVERIQVMKQPRFIPFARNEVNHGVRFRGNDLSAPHYHTSHGDNRACRSGLILKDVEYYITARVECRDVAPKPGSPLNRNNPGKHYAIFTRHARWGHHFRVPCFGCSEYRADFELANEVPPSPLAGERALGMMFHDYDYASPTGRPQPRFFDARMVNGVIEIPQLLA